MKLLFDNNVPVKLRRFLGMHQVRTARQLGWHRLANGSLLTAGEQAGFEVIVTGDKNIAYQQNLTGRKIAVVVLPTIDWNVLQFDTDRVAAAVERASPGSFEAIPQH